MSAPGIFAGVDPSARVLVALDIDGTLAENGDRPSVRVRTAVKLLADAGVMIVLATGRQLHGTTPVVVELGLPDTWVVASDGAIVARYAGTEQTMLATQMFDPRPLAAALLALDPYIMVGAEDLGVGYLVNRRFDKMIPRDHRQRIVAEFPGEVTMFTAGSTLLTGAELADTAGARGLSCTGWDEHGMGWIDVAAPGLSKGGGVASLAKIAALDRDFSLAVGDFYNDIELLRWADVGIAMEHAPDEVKAAADHVTGSIEEDGLAVVLEDLLAALNSARYA